MKLLDVYRQYSLETVFKTLHKLDTDPGVKKDVVSDIKCPEIVYMTQDFVDISMENVSAETTIKVRKNPAKPELIPISVSIGSLRMFESETSGNKAGVFWTGDKIVYTRDSLNGTLLGMQIVSDLFEKGITPHVPITMEAIRCIGEHGIPVDVIYTELIRTRFRDGGLTVSLADILDPEFEDNIKGLHISGLAPLVLKAQLLCTLDLLNSHDIYVGNVSAKTILISRMRRRPFFRGEDLNSFGTFTYILSNGAEIDIPNVEYFIRVADVHTIAYDGKLIYKGFIDGSSGSEGSYTEGKLGEHSESHDYSILRSELFDNDTRPFYEIAQDIYEQIKAISKKRRSKRDKTLVIRSRRM